MLLVPLPLPHFRRIRHDLGEECASVASLFCPITYCAPKCNFGAFLVALVGECARNIHEMRNPYSFGCKHFAPLTSPPPKFKILNSFGTAVLARQMLNYGHRRLAASCPFAFIMIGRRGSTHSAAGTETCGRNPMEGVQFSPMDRSNNDYKHVCTECGVIFEMRSNSEGAEIICDTCYSGQFEPVRIHHWQRIPSRLRRAR